MVKLYIIFLISFLIFLGVPIPCEVFMPLVGGYIKEHNISVIIIIIINSCSVFGAIILYFIGKKFKKIIKAKKIRQTINYYNNKGSIMILLGRLIPIVRIYISFAAGLRKDSFFEFLIYTFLGIMISNFFLIILGYVFYSNIHCILIYINKIKNVLILIVIIYALFRIIKKIIDNSNRR